MTHIAEVRKRKGDDYYANGEWNDAIKNYQSAIQILGLIKDKMKLFEEIRSSKLFIFPSLFEAMSMMLLEVASLRVPILASNIPANINMFSKEEVMFFKSNDPYDLSKKIEYCMKNQDEITKKADLALQRVKEDYDWEKIAENYSNIFNKLSTR